MEKVVSIAGLSGGIGLVGAALLTLWSADCAYAKDALKKPINVNSNNDQPSNTPISLATNFSERWGEEAPSSKEFFLGADGVVKDASAPETPADPSASSAMSTSKIGATERRNLEASRPGMTSPGQDEPTGSLNQIGAETALSSPSLGVKQCGASPMTPDEIKALVVETARRHKVDEGFALAIAWAESRFDEVRNSPKGARGPMQLIPETATRFGVADICDPAQNIEGGMKYLRVLLDEFQNPLLVAAAYNSGEDRIYEFGGVPPLQETVGYVAKVVNFQLGLPMPNGKRRTGKVAHEEAATNTNNGGGVIAVEKTGKFVGGVMHF